jgi:formate hydrogenlyase transcriptional activator
MEMLTNYPWNGNVRELANFIERAVIITGDQQLEVPLATLPTSPTRSLPCLKLDVQARGIEW